MFLWLYWPSFNAGPAYGNERHRAVVNTILSLSACTVVTFAVSAAVGKRKLNMVCIQLFYNKKVHSLLFNEYKWFGGGCQTFRGSKATLQLKFMPRLHVIFDLLELHAYYPTLIIFIYKFKQKSYKTLQ